LDVFFEYELVRVTIKELYETVGSNLKYMCLFSKMVIRELYFIVTKNQRPQLMSELTMMIFAIITSGRR